MTNVKRSKNNVAVKKPITKKEKNLGGKSKLVFLHKIINTPDWNDPSLVGLSESLSRSGQLQQVVLTPVFGKKGKKQYEIVLGRRRVAAAERNHHQSLNTKCFKGKKIKNLALRQKGWSQVRAFIIEDRNRYNLLEAGFLGTHLDKGDILDLAADLQKMKITYELEFPETKHGANGGGKNGRGTKTKKNTQVAQGKTSVASQPRFFKYMAGKLGKSESWLRKIAALHYLSPRKKRELAEGKISMNEAYEEITSKSFDVNAHNKVVKEHNDYFDMVVNKTKGKGEVGILNYLSQEASVPESEAGLMFLERHLDYIKKKKEDLERKVLSEQQSDDDPAQPHSVADQFLSYLWDVEEFLSDSEKLSQLRQAARPKLKAAAFDKKIGLFKKLFKNARGLFEQD